MVDVQNQTGVRPAEDDLDGVERAYYREIDKAAALGDSDKAYVLQRGLEQYRELYKAAS